MYKNVLQAINGIEIYPMISFAIFFLFFIGLLAYVVAVGRDHFNAMSQIPLNSDNALEADEQGGSFI